MDISEINRQLPQVEERMHRRKKLQKRLFHAKQALDKERLRLADLEKRLQKEGADLKKYQGMSLPALFHTLLGNKESQVEKERREFLEVKLQRDEAAYSVKELEREIDQTQAEIEELANAADEFDRLLTQKEALIVASYPVSANRLNEMTRDAAAVRSEILEISEAASAGAAARVALDDLIHSLTSAGDWGVWDLLGGGVLSTAVKHTRMDEARDHLHRVQQHLGQFRRELEDVQQVVAGAQIHLGEFERFADIFFDGLIVDWMVQAKIEQSLAKAQEARQKVESILQSLTTRQSQLARQVEKLEADREQLIREA